MSADLSWVLDLDRTVHEPARLLLFALLSGASGADFVYLLEKSGLTRGNLSCHLSRLEDAGYVKSEKYLRDDRARTLYELTGEGRDAWKAYRKRMGMLV